MFSNISLAPTSYNWLIALMHWLWRRRWWWWWKWSNAWDVLRDLKSTSSIFRFAFVYDRFWSTGVDIRLPHNLPIVAVVSPQSAHSICTSAFRGAETEVVVLNCRSSAEAPFDTHVGWCKRVSASGDIHLVCVIGDLRVVRNLRLLAMCKAFITIEFRCVESTKDCGKARIMENCLRCGRVPGSVWQSTRTNLHASVKTTALLIVTKISESPLSEIMRGHTADSKSL